MDFPEAIRQGAKLRPQGYGDFFTRILDYRRGRPSGLRVGSCALGAAAEALGVPRVLDPEVCNRALKDAFPDLFAAGLEVRIGVLRYGFRDAVAYLNDRKHWSREHIADWVEQEVLTGRAVVKENE